MSSGTTCSLLIVSTKMHSVSVVSLLILVVHGKSVCVEPVDESTKSGMESSILPRNSL